MQLYVVGSSVIIPQRTKHIVIKEYLFQTTKIENEIQNRPRQTKYDAYCDTRFST